MQNIYEYAGELEAVIEAIDAYKHDPFLLQKFTKKAVKLIENRRKEQYNDIVRNK